MNRGNKAEYSGNEKWQKFKKEFWGKKLLATTEWGLIDFDPQGKDDMVGGDALSYDEYLDLQMQSGKRVRTYFEICYYDADFFSFKGRIKRINTKKQLLCFERIFVEDLYGDGDGFSGKEDHVWMSLTGFENYRVGDCLFFEAEVYRYLKTSRGKMIDFGLKDPVGIRKVGEYEVPSDEQLRIQARSRYSVWTCVCSGITAMDSVLPTRNGKNPCSICFLEGHEKNFLSYLRQRC